MSVAKNTNQKSSAKFESSVELQGSSRKLPSGKNIGNTSFNELI
jgi:hypothetical protein